MYLCAGACDQGVPLAKYIKVSARLQNAMMSLVQFDFEADEIVPVGRLAARSGFALEGVPCAFENDSQVGPGS